MPTTRIEEDAVVTAVVTAMTDGEEPFLLATMKAVMASPHISQIVLCVEESNSWVEAILQRIERQSELIVARLPLMPPGAIRNRALHYVREEWVAFCDGDDVWCSDKIRTQLETARLTGCDFVGADHCLIDQQNGVRAFALSRHIPMTSSWMVRTEVMRSYPFDETMYQGEDGNWWIRTNHVIRKVRCPEILLRYRVRSGSISSSTPSKKRKALVSALAGFPLVGMTVFGATYLVWLFNRKDHYVWLADWGESVRGAQPS